VGLAVLVQPQFVVGFCGLLQNNRCGVGAIGLAALLASSLSGFAARRVLPASVQRLAEERGRSKLLALRPQLNAVPLAAHHVLRVGAAVFARKSTECREPGIAKRVLRGDHNVKPVAIAPTEGVAPLATNPEIHDRQEEAVQVGWALCWFALDRGTCRRQAKRLHGAR